MEPGEEQAGALGAREGGRSQPGPLLLARVAWGKGLWQVTRSCVCWGATCHIHRQGVSSHKRVNQVRLCLCDASGGSSGAS